MNVINDVNVIKMIQQGSGQDEIRIGETIIRFPTISQHGISGDFGEFTPN